MYGEVRLGKEAVVAYFMVRYPPFRGELEEGYVRSQDGLSAGRYLKPGPLE